MIGRLPFYRTFIGVLCMGICMGASSQTTYSLSLDGVTLDEALRLLSTTSGVQLVYSPDMVPARSADGTYQGEIEEILTTLLYDSGLSFRRENGQIILFRKEAEISPFIVSGYIEDVDSGERLIGAHVYDLQSGMGAVTNAYGFFSLQSRGSDAELRVSYLGYGADTIRIQRHAAGDIQSITLGQLLVLREVIIEDTEDRYMAFEPLASHEVSKRKLETRINLGGEHDPQRFMETLPGVSIGIDGIGGLHVRGGNGDQNLILFDGVPVYHSTHAIGILSVFNPLMVREVRLDKGEFPARYAGRLSSVLDVRTKEGNNKQWSMQSSLGIATVNALVEGPLIRDKAGVLIAARKFVPGFYLRDLSAKEKARDNLSGETSYGFADVNAKVHFALTERDRIYVSFYRGDDDYEDLTGRFTSSGNVITTETFSRTLSWGNSVGVLRWNHQFGKNLFLNTTGILSKFELSTNDNTEFNQRLPDQTEIDGFITRKFESSIRDAGVRLDFDHYLSNRNRLRYGAAVTRHTLAPKSIVFDDEATINGFPVDERGLDELLASLQDRTVESGIYAENEYRVGELLRISGGVHLSRFDVRDATYWSLQPRLSATVSLLPGWNLHASAGKMTQYLHLLTSSGIGLPTDLWVPATPSVKPQNAYQASAGMSWEPAKEWTLQAEYYYRKLENLVAYEEGASFLFREGALPSGIVDAANWENKVTQGTGRATGLEVSAAYEDMHFDFRMAYTYARSTRQFEELNFGKRFPFRFDRRHALSLSGSVYLSERLVIAAGWNFASGIPITLAESRVLHPSSIPIFPSIQFSSVQIIGFSEKNAYRLPAYHRLDLGMKYVWHREKAHHSIQVDLYNVYNRDNILYVTLIQEGDTFKNQQFTVLPFIPSISYHLKI